MATELECNSLEFTCNGMNIPRCDKCGGSFLNHGNQDQSNIKGETFGVMKPMSEIADQVVATFSMKVPINIINKSDNKYPKQLIDEYQSFLDHEGYQIIGFDRQKGWSYHVFYYHCKYK